MSVRCGYMPTLSFNTMWIKVFHHYHNYVCDAIYSPVFHIGVPDFNYTELKWLHFFSSTWENKRVCIIRHHTTLSPLWWLGDSTICEESMPVGTCSFLMQLFFIQPWICMRYASSSYIFMPQIEVKTPYIFVFNTLFQHFFPSDIFRLCVATVCSYCSSYFSSISWFLLMFLTF